MQRLLVVVVLVVAACSAGKTGRGTQPTDEPRPPAPPAGSRFVCDRKPFDPRVTWRDCQLAAQPLHARAYCFSARAARDVGRIHSLCAPSEADCRRWHDARKRERQDVVDPCVQLRASQTGTLDGSPPPFDGQFLCEPKPDERRMVGWRECRVVDATLQDHAHCFVTKWRGGRHSVCAPTHDECREWSQRRRTERNDVLAECKQATVADYWPLPAP